MANVTVKALKDDHSGKEFAESQIDPLYLPLRALENETVLRQQP
jgi:hypothetical protein